MLNLNITFIMWRELFEAVLITSIVFAVISKSVPLAKARATVGTGIVAGIVLSLLAALVIGMANSQLSGVALDYFQVGILFVCALLMTHMCIWMKQHGRHIKSEIQDSIGNAASRSQIVVIALVALAIAREGIEIVVFLWGMGIATEAGGITTILLSSLAGIALTALCAFAVLKGLKFFNQKLFFRITSIALLVTASTLVLTAVQRLIQNDILPPLIEPIWDTSWLLSESNGIGKALAAIAGYQEAPSLMTVLFYAGYWLLYVALAKTMSKSLSLSWLKGNEVSNTAAKVALALMLFAAADRSEAISPQDTKTRVTGFGDIQFNYYDYGPNGTLKDGAPKDSRMSFDATRFSTKFEGFYLPHDIEFEAEIEFEHGGTGVSTEIEYEESGEFETEVEKGGEVQLEEFYLKKVLFQNFIAAVGRIKVGMGVIALNSSPADYLGVARPETESHIIPESWNEMGVEGVYETENVRIQGQIINGLDSTGFSSEYWVASVHQSRFEETRASDLAYVTRFDVLTFDGIDFGASLYYGDTTRNRPQADLVQSCGKTDETKVAPCGYVHAPVTIADLHARVQYGNIRANTALLWGRLKNAGKVSERNRRLSNQLEVARTPVADEAYGYWGEFGYDIGSHLGLGSIRSLEPFARMDQYDTMYKTDSGQIDNPRFERRILSAGLAYTLDHAVMTKFNISRKTFGSKNLRPQTSAAVGLGFIF